MLNALRQQSDVHSSHANVVCCTFNTRLCYLQGGRNPAWVKRCLRPFEAQHNNGADSQAGLFGNELLALTHLTPLMPLAIQQMLAGAGCLIMPSMPPSCG